MNEEILKKKIEGQMFFIIAIGLLESFTVTAVCVFIPSGIKYYIELLTISTVLNIVSFIKFIILIMRITKLNISYIVKEIDESNRRYVQTQVKLDDIQDKLDKINIKLDS